MHAILYRLVRNELFFSILGMGFHILNAGIVESLHKVWYTLLSSPVNNANRYIALNPKRLWLVGYPHRRIARNVVQP
jgi:hypothetical protein